MSVRIYLAFFHLSFNFALKFTKVTENFADSVAGTINTEVKEYKIFEMSEKSDVIGKMKIQFSPAMSHWVYKPLMRKSPCIANDG